MHLWSGPSFYSRILCPNASQSQKWNKFSCLPLFWNNLISQIHFTTMNTSDVIERISQAFSKKNFIQFFSFSKYWTTMFIDRFCEHDQQQQQKKSMLVSIGSCKFRWQLKCFSVKFCCFQTITWCLEKEITVYQFHHLEDLYVLLINHSIF